MTGQFGAAARSNRDGEVLRGASDNFKALTGAFWGMRAENIEGRAPFVTVSEKLPAPLGLIGGNEHGRGNQIRAE